MSSSRESNFNLQSLMGKVVIVLGASLVLVVIVLAILLFLKCNSDPSIKIITKSSEVYHRLMDEVHLALNLKQESAKTKGIKTYENPFPAVEAIVSYQTIVQVVYAIEKNGPYFLMTTSQKTNCTVAKQMDSPKDLDMYKQQDCKTEAGEIYCYGLIMFEETASKRFMTCSDSKEGKTVAKVIASYRIY